VSPTDPGTTVDSAAIRARAEALYAPFLDDLQALVGIDSGSYAPVGVNRVADLMRERFESAGWEVERFPHPRGELGDVLSAAVPGSEPNGSRILLVGHMDTVFAEGTAAKRPFRMEGDRAFGPGVSDMKGGLLAGCYAIRCLQEAGLDRFARVTYVCNPDEEIGSPWSGPFIEERAAQADVCFVLEGARENGDIVSARKGVSDVRVTIHGRAAHAGVEPERGRPATLQAAHTTVALHELNGRWPGVTVNVGVIQGGTRTNVVAERCDLQVDVRAPNAASFEQALAEVRRVAEATVVPDTTVELEVGTGFPPMEKTEATGRLVALARSIASDLGFEVNDAATGGGSDANAVAAVGVPVLDGLGPIGGDDHSPKEWLDTSSIVPRVSLLAGLVAAASSATAPR
jgi:glutamate carboxypeptidase